MTTIDDDPDEAGVPEMAVKGLNEASRRSAELYPQVLVQDRCLVRIDSNGTTILKKLPERRKVTTGIIHLSHE